MENKYEYLFPFEKIPQGAKILIYGAGDVGQEYLQQIMMTGYCEVVGFIDRNWDKYAKMIVPIYPVVRIHEVSYDYIVIAMKTTMAMIVGIFFGKIYNLLHWWVVPSGIVALLIGSLAIPQGHLWLVCLGSVISGICSPLIGAYSFKTISETAPSGKENAINTMVLIGFNAGSFVAPIALTTGGNLFGGTVKSDFYFMASIFAILLVIVISQKIISRNQTQIKLI